MKGWKFLLFPFAVIYDLITRFRNHLYNIAYFKSIAFDRPVISVGNLAVGGTGKTPMVAFLAKHLISEGKSVGIVSKGYGRKDRSIRICDASANPETVGDEPYLLFHHFGGQVPVAVGENRAFTIPFLLAEYPEIEVILMDDGFQHRIVKPSIQILLSTADRPFWKDYLMPFGKLRENRSQVSRADLLVISKVEKEFPVIPKEIQKPDAYTNVQYGEIELFHGEKKNQKVILVAGIADPSYFFEFAAGQYEVIETLRFPDHHRYSKKDITQIKGLLTEDITLITTEKDAVKLKYFEELRAYSCAYLPISVHFLEGEERFLQKVDLLLKSNLTNR